MEEGAGVICRWEGMSAEGILRKMYIFVFCSKQPYQDKAPSQSTGFAPTILLILILLVGVRVSFPISSNFSHQHQLCFFANQFPHSIFPTRWVWCIGSGTGWKRGFRPHEHEVNRQNFQEQREASSTRVTLQGGRRRRRGTSNLYETMIGTN